MKLPRVGVDVLSNYSLLLCHTSYNLDGEDLQQLVSSYLFEHGVSFYIVYVRITSVACSHTGL